MEIKEAKIVLNKLILELDYESPPSLDAQDKIEALKMAVDSLDMVVAFASEEE